MANYKYVENPIKKVFNEFILQKSPSELVEIEIEDLNNLMKKIHATMDKKTKIDISEYYNIRNGVLRFYRKAGRKIEKLSSKEQSRLLEICKNSKDSMDIKAVQYLEKAIYALERAIEACQGNKEVYYKKNKTNMTADFVKINNVINKFLNEIPPLEDSLQNRCEELRAEMESLRIKADLEKIMDKVGNTMKETNQILSNTELQEMIYDIEEEEENSFENQLNK